MKRQLAAACELYLLTQSILFVFKDSAHCSGTLLIDRATVQDALQWEQVHVIGHSMGAMVATQLASMHPEKLLSLTLISVTAGRWQSVPTNWAAIKYAWQVTHLSPVAWHLVCICPQHMHLSCQSTCSQDHLRYCTVYYLLPVGFQSNLKTLTH